MKVLSHVTLETPAETAARCKSHGATWFGDNIIFSLPGGSFKRGHVRAMFRPFGWEKHLPAEPKPSTLLTRASREGKNPANYKTEKFVSPNSDALEAVHVSRVSGTDESGDEYSCLARVRIAFRIDPKTGDKEPFASAKPPQGQTEYVDMTARDRALWVASKCNNLLHHAENKDIGLFLRSVLKGIGCVQSRGGGNNFYVPVALCQDVHDLMCSLKKAGMLGWHDRKPETSLGAKHTQAKMSEAVTASFADQIVEIRDQLKDSIERGTGRKRDVYFDGKLEEAAEMDARLLMFRDVIESKYVEPLRETIELYRQKFQCLKDGGKVTEIGDDDWFVDEDEPAPVTDRSPEAPSEPEPATPSAPASSSASVAAAADSDDEFACFM